MAPTGSGLARAARRAGNHEPPGAHPSDKDHGQGEDAPSAHRSSASRSSVSIMGPWHRSIISRTTRGGRSLGDGCRGCLDQERLGRRRFLQLLASGLTLALAGCTRVTQARDRPRATVPSVPVAEQAPIVTDPDAGPPLALGTIPPPHPGTPTLVWSGPGGTNQIALTVDDGYCGPCIAGYVAFAQQSGVHITFNPNGVFGDLWTPSIVTAVRQMVADEQVQIGNHTWDHANLLSLSSPRVAEELSHNEDWIEQTFGITARPYFRPPYGYYDSRVMAVAADLGYTSILMWNGTFGDATVETPTQLIALAEQWLTPGTIMLGHLNHPTILSLFSQIESIITDRNLEPVTLDEMFGTSRGIG